MQDRAREDLARLFAAELAKSGLAAEALETYATPRRLALIARGLPEATEPVREETKGPRASAPPQALEGFLRKTGLAADQLEDRGGILFAVVERPGRATAQVLADAIPAIVRAFPWPKSMRWGAASADTTALRWVRPLAGIVALFGDDVVECEVDGIRSDAATVGHRFHHPGIVTIGNADDYATKLRACHVLADQDERRAIIRDRAQALASEAGLTLVEDEGLVAENAGLAEWPVPLLGHFDPGFLDVPPEVVQLTARVNQKYFVCTPIPPRDGEGDRREAVVEGAERRSATCRGHVAAAEPAREASRGPQATKLSNAFVCTANIEATDGGAAIVAGNEKVLSARLADARFFWEQDLKVPLDEQAAKLDQIVFHEKLGTIADKVDRVAKLARWLVEEGIVGASRAPAKAGAQGSEGPNDPGLLPSQEHDRAQLAELAERAARLCKADLVTGMVGEFPELQGIMGGYYATAQGEDPQVAAAIRDHYKPVGQGDEVPTAPVTVAVSLADKLDTMAAFFSVGEKPTGSKDPFALRRAAISVISLLLTSGIRANLRSVFITAALQATFSKQVGPFARASAAIGAVAQLRSGLMWNDVVLPLIGAAATQANEDASRFVTIAGAASEELLSFFADRLKVQQREAGVRHDLIDAVFALGGEDDLVRLLARVRALQAFVATEDGANLLAGYKRAANILRIEEKKDAASSSAPAQAGAQAGNGPELDPRLREGTEVAKTNQIGYTPLPEEAALLAALDAAEPAAAAAVEAEDFAGAMRALAGLRAPIDAFFDKVTVNDADADKRRTRLGLLARIRDAVHRVADFSKIEG